MSDSCFLLINGEFMDTNDIVLAIDVQIAQLQKAKAILKSTELTEKRKPGRPSRASAHYKATSVEAIGHK
jgi:hypothetical protein